MLVAGDKARWPLNDRMAYSVFADCMDNTALGVVGKGGELCGARMGVLASVRVKV